jgi:iron(III) transport system ATP-binding protein
MLLDEPLTNLDANLREEMRFEIKELQRKTGTTIFYVTHDQEVALAISDRMAIMDSHGRIRQTGTPDDVYENPVDEFVHQFLGIPNYIPVHVVGGVATIVQPGSKTADTAKTLRIPELAPAGFPDGEGKAACRPMDIILEKDIQGEAVLPATVLRLSLLGPIVDYLLDVGGIQLRAQIQTEEALVKDMIIDKDSRCGIRFAGLKWFGKNGEALR